MPPETTPQQQILDQILLASQLDQLHLSVTLLLEMVRDGEIDLFLDGPGKNDRQKALYLTKVIEKVTSPPLKNLLEKELAKKDFNFFARLQLEDFLAGLEKSAEKSQVIKLMVAVNFEDADLREMADLFGKRLGRPVVLDITVDRELIGGAIIQHGNYLSDYTIRTRLGQFREEWHQDLTEHHED